MVLASSAELARPKKGELNTPTMPLMLVWLIALNASTLNSRLFRLSFARCSPHSSGTLKLLVKRRSSCVLPGPRPVLRVTPAGRSFATVSPLLSNPVVMLNGAALIAESTNPSRHAHGSVTAPMRLKRCLQSKSAGPISGRKS